MSKQNPKHIIVVDQGSRSGPPVIDSKDTRSLIIDHHLSDEFPKGAQVLKNPLDYLILPDRTQVVSACHYPPVATSSLLTYEICKPMHPSLESECAFLCAMGTHGDLGSSLKWKAPFPDMADAFKTYSKKAINDAVSLVNARTVD